MQKLEYLENGKSFLNKTKSISHNSLRTIIWRKKQKWQAKALKTQIILFQNENACIDQLCVENNKQTIKNRPNLCWKIPLIWNWLKYKHPIKVNHDMKNLETVNFLHFAMNLFYLFHFFKYLIYFLIGCITLVRLFLTQFTISDLPQYFPSDLEYRFNVQYPQNGQTQFKNLPAIAAIIFTFVWPFYS